MEPLSQWKEAQCDKMELEGVETVVPMVTPVMVEAGMFRWCVV